MSALKSQYPISLVSASQRSTKAAGTSPVQYTLAPQSCKCWRSARWERGRCWRFLARKAIRAGLFTLLVKRGPEERTSVLSSPASEANCTWAWGSVPRTTSVKRLASAMASRKVVAGKLCWQGSIGVWPAFFRVAFTVTAWTSSCWM